MNDKRKGKIAWRGRDGDKGGEKGERRGRKRREEDGKLEQNKRVRMLFILSHKELADLG